MKKTQLLSAIALAFALGVVAPVASTNAQGATPFAIERPEETTSKADVDAAVAKVTAQPEYKAYATLNELKGATDYNQATALTTLNAAIKKVDNTYTDATTLADAIKAAEGLEDYAKWSALYSAMQDDASVSVNDQITKISEAIKGLGFNVPATDDTKTPAENLTALKKEVTDNTEYTNMAGVIEDVTEANEGIETEAQNITDLKDALAKAGVDARDITAAAEGKTPVASLATLATTATNSTRGTAYATLRTAVEDAKGADAGDTANNTTLLNDLKDAYKAAAGVDLDDATTPVDPVDPVDPTDPEEPGTDVPTDPTTPTNPTTPDDTNNGQGSVSDGTGFGSTPNTGVVAKSGGSASTSVAIMAAISTVVAGFGAAIVAIRNFKRNKNA